MIKRIFMIFVVIFLLTGCKTDKDGDVVRRYLYAESIFELSDSLESLSYAQAAEVPTQSMTYYDIQGAEVFYIVSRLSSKKDKNRKTLFPPRVDYLITGVSGFKCVMLQTVYNANTDFSKQEDVLDYGFNPSSEYGLEFYKQQFMDNEYDEEKLRMMTKCFVDCDYQLYFFPCSDKKIESKLYFIYDKDTPVNQANETDFINKLKDSSYQMEVTIK